jgi:hypothetical protein
MSRPLALALAAALLSLRSAPALAEPLDLELSRLGAPSAEVWTQAASNAGLTIDAPTAAALANESKTRFAVLSTETALALSSALLQPASTTGHAGFDVQLEAAYAGVHPQSIGSTSLGGFGPRSPWQTRGLVPHELFLPSVHVRKALPFSFELGGRMIYLSQSSYFAAQVEGKWALNEGSAVLPDVAVRAAYTKLFGHRDLDLGAMEVDLVASKRWGVNGVTSLTPYAAARFSYVSASSEVIDFSPTTRPGATESETRVSQAAFPKLRNGFYRTTAGVRLTAYLVSLAAEATYFGGKRHEGESAPDAGEYGDFTLPSSWAGALKFGWEF